MAGPYNEPIVASGPPVDGMASESSMTPERMAEIAHAMHADKVNDTIDNIGAMILKGGEKAWPYIKGTIQALVFPAGLKRQWQKEDEAAMAGQQQQFFDNLRGLQGGGEAEPMSGGTPPRQPGVLPTSAPLIGTPQIDRAVDTPPPPPAPAPNQPLKKAGWKPGMDPSNFTTASDLPAEQAIAARSGVVPRAPGTLETIGPQAGPWASGYTSPDEAMAYQRLAEVTAPAGAPASAPPSSQPAQPVGLQSGPTGPAMAPLATTPRASTPITKPKPEMTVHMPIPGMKGGSVTTKLNSPADARARRLDLENEYWNTVGDVAGELMGHGMAQNDAYLKAQVIAQQKVGYVPGGMRGVFATMANQPTLLESEQKRSDIRVAEANQKADIKATAPTKMSPAERKDAGTMLEMVDIVQDLGEQFRGAQAAVGPFVGRAGKLSDILGGNAPAAAAFRAANASLTNTIVYLRSGKQINEAEAKRLLNEVPTYENINVTAWVSRFGNAVRIVHRAIEKKNRVAKANNLVGSEVYDDALHALETQFPSFLGRAVERRDGKPAPTPAPTPQATETPTAAAPPASGSSQPTRIPAADFLAQ